MIRNNPIEATVFISTKDLTTDIENIPILDFKKVCAKFVPGTFIKLSETTFMFYDVTDVICLLPVEKGVTGLMTLNKERIDKGIRIDDLLSRVAFNILLQAVNDTHNIIFKNYPNKAARVSFETNQYKNRILNPNECTSIKEFCFECLDLFTMMLSIIWQISAMILRNTSRFYHFIIKINVMDVNNNIMAWLGY